MADTHLIFHYWVKDLEGKIHRVTKEDYCGDCGETMIYMGRPVTIEDWTYETLDRA